MAVISMFFLQADEAALVAVVDAAAVVVAVAEEVVVEAAEVASPLPRTREQSKNSKAKR